jgi:hypothetical protein
MIPFDIEKGINADVIMKNPTDKVSGALQLANLRVRNLRSSKYLCSRTKA